MPMLKQGRLEDALKVAREITDTTDHDVAIARIAFRFADKGEADKAKAILKEMWQEERRKWGEFCWNGTPC